MIEAEEISAKEQPPVLLENNAFARPVEGVVESFGLPKKGEFDPSAIMAVFYYILFGMMLSDAAYGLIVSLVCGIVLLKFPRIEENLRKSIQLFFWCGISTLVWGILFGGYFGDALDVISETFFGHKISIPALWFVPLNEPMRMLLYSMLFGVIHLFTGLALKGYMCIRDHKYMDFICDVVFWYMLLLGLIGILIPSSMFAGIAGKTDRIHRGYRPKEKGSNSRFILILIALVFLSPFIITAASGVFSILLVVILFPFLAIFVSGVVAFAFIVAACACISVGVGILVTNTAVGLLVMGIGCLLFASGILFCILTGWLGSRFSHGFFRKEQLFPENRVSE